MDKLNDAIRRQDFVWRAREAVNKGWVIALTALAVGSLDLAGTLAKCEALNIASTVLTMLAPGVYLLASIALPVLFDHTGSLIPNRRRPSSTPASVRRTPRPAAPPGSSP